MDKGDNTLKKVGEISLGEEVDTREGSNVSKSRKVFGFDTEGKPKVRPSNTVIRDLLGYDRFKKRSWDS